MKFLIVLTFVLTSCASKPSIMPGGDKVNPPAGYIQYCKDFPKDPGCPKKK